MAKENTEKKVNKKTTTAKKTTILATKAKKTTTKKETIKTKKQPAKKVATKTAVNSVNPAKESQFLEYYDLPYRYNETTIQILAQTPKTLFVYWDISDKDRQDFIKKYGNNFFEETKPVLIIHNKTKNYTFEIDINDFANSWYFNVNDTKCEYEIELGRRNTERNILSNNYLYIASSNKIEAPNDHILFEKELKTIFFKNTKTNKTYSKDLANLSYIKHLGKAYKLFDFYNENFNESDLQNNPSSNFRKC